MTAAGQRQIGLSFIMVFDRKGKFITKSTMPVVLFIHLKCFGDSMQYSAKNVTQELFCFFVFDNHVHLHTNDRPGELTVLG